MSERRFEKGFFTANRFQVAAKYLTYVSRRRLFVMGAIAALVLTALFLVDAFVGRASAVAGALSESHAYFGKDCSTCHSAVKGAPSVKCEGCHQKTDADLAVYSFARHYEYRSGELDRSGPDGKEVSCGSCHREHKGRTHSLQAVADGQCKSCHEVGSFKRKHPEFDFAADKTPDPANLKFTHVLHVREVMSEHDLKDAEQACLRCHTPQPDGKNFKPLSYAQACDGCHLQETESDPIPVRGGGPGVLTLGQIRAIGGPGTTWAAHWNPGEFNDLGGEISKSPLYHADPWVMYNLKRLRQEMYPGAELADLLQTSPDVSARDARALYEEAISQLKQDIQSLRGNPSPDVQRELTALNALLAKLEEKIEQPYTTTDLSKFAVSAADLAPGIDEAAYTRVIDALTGKCQDCHVVERATIRRVQTDQRSLVRSEFDHKAHVIHAKCLDCHNTIPMRDWLGQEDDPPENVDRAAIVNIPTIQTCRSCHTSRGPSTSCTSCHLMHPDKSHWSKLTR